MKNFTLFIFAVCLIIATGYQSCFAKSPYTYCFIGDSKFVGMEQAINTDEEIIWINKNGAKKDFYWENREYVSSLDRNTVIVYELGINDLDSNGCIEALQDLENLGFKHIYFVSVTPVEEFKINGPKIENIHIEEFNENIKNNIPSSVAFIDSYSHFTTIGFDTIDGVHYTDDTYQMWFYNIIENL